MNNLKSFRTVPNNQSSLRARLVLSTALATIAFGYGSRGVYAGACVPGGGGSFSCSGLAAPGSDTSQTLSSAGVTITTIADFGINTAVGNAFTISGTGAGGVNFDDSGNPGGSAITSATSTAMRVTSSGGGPVSITTNGAISGNADGIKVNNTSGSNAVSVTTNGTVNANTGYGIYVGTYGSSGDTTITANSDVTSGGNRTIYAFGYSATSDITINAGNVTNQSNNVTAVYAANSAGGNHNVDITVSGTVAIGAGSTLGYGIGIQKAASTGNINVTLDSGANVSGGSDAILIGGGSSSNSTLTINSGGGFTGSARMFGATNNVVINGGDVSGVTTITANSAADSVTFGTGTTTATGSQFVGFETLTVGAGGTANIGGTLNISSNSVSSGGTLSAGASPGGLLNIFGNLDVGTGATTLVKLAGLIAATNYDLIGVNGTASLAAGSIFDIDFFGGFTANLGDFFDVLVAGAITVADLNTVTFDFSDAVLGAGLGWQTEIVGGEVLRLSVAEDAIPLPEPSTLLLFCAGTLGIVGMKRRRRKAA
jgi:fibronectin-binding autotransporter adhesin